MTLDAIMEKAADDMLRIGGKDAVYIPVNWQPGDAEEVSCQVMLYRDVLVQGDGYNMEMATLGSTITAKVSDVGTLERGDVFEIGDDEWKVVNIESNDGLMVTAVVKCQ